jgi:hypothetical protein
MEQEENKEELEEDIGKYCLRCKLKIGVKDNYCRLTEWKMGKFHGEGFYHTKCFREGMHGNVEEKNLKAKSNLLIDKVFGLVEKMEGRI